jgi:hypothetical protein
MMSTDERQPLLLTCDQHIFGTHGKLFSEVTGSIGFVKEAIFSAILGLLKRVFDTPTLNKDVTDLVQSVFHYVTSVEETLVGLLGQVKEYTDYVLITIVSIAGATVLFLLIHAGSIACLMSYQQSVDGRSHRLDIVLSTVRYLIVMLSFASALIGTLIVLLDHYVIQPALLLPIAKDCDLQLDIFTSGVLLTVSSGISLVLAFMEPCVWFTQRMQHVYTQNSGCEMVPLVMQGDTKS